MSIKTICTHSMLAVLAVIVLSTHGVCQEEDPLAGVKCVVAGSNNAKLEHAVDYMDGKVYFCCGNCKKKFEDKHEEFLAKANHQLVVTGQYKQKACPITGMDVKEGTNLTIGGVDVGFCCNRCKGSVESAGELADKAELVFAHEAFKKGFEKASKLDGITCPVGGGEVSEEFAADYMGAKVYFCCQNCVDAFAKDSDKHAVLANHQLAATGQFVQKNCPFSGQPMNKEHMTKVGKVKVGFCCDGCSSKVSGTEEGEKRINLVFKTEAFKKAFEIKKDDDK